MFSRWAKPGICSQLFCLQSVQTCNNHMNAYRTFSCLQNTLHQRLYAIYRKKRFLPSTRYTFVKYSSCLTANSIRSFKSLSSSAAPEETKTLSDVTKSSKKPKVQALRKLFSLASTERWSLSGGVVLLGISSTVTMSVPFVVGTLIDSIYSGGQTSTPLLSLVDTLFSNSNAISTESATQVPAITNIQESITKVCTLLAGIFLVGGAANAGRVYLMTTAGQRISQRLRSMVFGSVLQQEIAFFDRHSTGELVSRLAADTPIVASAVTANVADGLRAAVMATVAVSMMVYSSPQLALFGLSVVPPVGLIVALYGRKLRKLATGVQEKLAFCTQHAEERLSNIRTVRMFSREQREVSTHNKLLNDALKVMYTETKSRASFFGLTGLTGNMIILSVLYKGSALVSEGFLSVGSLSAFLMYAAYVGISVGSLSSVFTELNKGAGAAERLFELLDRKSLMPLHGGLDLRPDSMRGEVHFKGVSFCYPTRPKTLVLHDFDLRVEAGRILAVVGGSGSGKSTLIALLLRLYDPESGVILLDGTDISTLDPASLRAAIGVVAQEPVLFSGSIRDNLVYGVSEPTAVTDSRLEEAAHQANALEFIANFPQGFKTLVGERGVLLSGGQRQRLAIARALITDPAVLCLDEATSALDSESEYLVQEAVERLMKGRTVLTVAHRLSTIRTADSVAVLQHGAVAEYGSYAELISRPDGVFRKLISRQTTDII